MVLVCFNNWQKVLAGVFVTLFPFIDDFHFERKDLNSHMYQLWPEWSCFWIVDEPPERPYCTTWDVTPVFHGGYSPRIYVAYLHGCYTYNAWDAHPSSWWFIDVHRCSMWSTIEKKMWSWSALKHVVTLELWLCHPEAIRNLFTGRVSWRVPRGVPGPGWSAKSGGWEKRGTEECRGIWMVDIVWLS